MNIALITIFYSIGVFFVYRELACFEYNGFQPVNKRSSILYLFLLAVFVILITFRDISVPDTDNYIKLIKNDSYESFAILIKGLTIALKTIFGESAVRVLFSVIAIANSLITTKATKEIYFAYNNAEINVNKSKSSLNLDILSLILFVPYFGLYYSGIAIRAGIAMALIIYAFAKFLNNKKIIGTIIFFVGVLFHYSTIICIIVIPVLLIRHHLTRKILIFIWIVIGICFFVSTIFIQNMVGQLLDMIYNIYHWEWLKIDYYYNSRGKAIELTYVFWFILGGLMLFTKQISNQIYLKCVLIYFTGLFMLSTLNSIVIIGRVSDMFLYLSIPIMYIFLKMNNRFSRVFRYLITIILITAELVLSLNITGYKIV